MLFQLMNLSHNHNYKTLASLTILAHCIKCDYKDTFSLSTIVSYKIGGASCPVI